MASWRATLQWSDWHQHPALAKETRPDSSMVAAAPACGAAVASRSCAEGSELLRGATEEGGAKKVLSQSQK